MASPVIIISGEIGITPETKILKSSDYEYYLKGQEIIDRANQQAENIIEKSKLAYEKKKEEGYQDGLNESKIDQAEHMLKVVSRTIEYLSDVEKAMADILLSSIKKIVGDFDQEDLTINLVKNALQHVRNEKQVSIRISPDQYTAVQSRINEILSEYKGVGFIDLVSDPRLSVGDCIMESDIGVVDASIELQIMALQKRLDHLNSEAVKTIAQDTSFLS